MDERNDYKSALHVMGGIEQPRQINEEVIRKLRSGRSKSLSVQDYLEGIWSGNRTVLSKAITLIESVRADHQAIAREIIDGCLKRGLSAASFRIGITGVPGVGKSSFIETLGRQLTASGHRIAVLAVDPSSSRSKGSILGDKTRMEALSVDPGAFIRPSPSAGSLGGVTRKTRETIILCEAAGYDIIFVETVGVGQSETAVHSMVDFFLLLMLAGAGDELQGIKRGIMEMADGLVINKADGDNLRNAQRAMAEYRHALHFFPPPPSGWQPFTEVCSANTGLNIREIWDTILAYKHRTTANGYFSTRRQEQDLQCFREAIEQALRFDFFNRKEISRTFSTLEKQIIQGNLSPYDAASRLLARYFGQQDQHYFT